MLVRILPLVVILAAVAALAGCGGDATPQLDGTNWLLTSWSETGQDPGDFTITADFADGKVGGKSAVNTYGGPYTVGPGDAFSVGELASTMMAGPEPDMRAEQTYLSLLAAARACSLEGDTLTLFDGDGAVSLVFTARQP